MQGSLGYDPKTVVQALMRVVSERIGIQLADASLAGPASSSTWAWAAAQDPSAPPGRVRLLLPDVDAVTRLRAAVHGRAVQIGADLISIEVLNDLIDHVGQMPGNAGRARASRGPAPAALAPGGGRGPPGPGRQ